MSDTRELNSMYDSQEFKQFDKARQNGDKDVVREYYKRLQMRFSSILLEEEFGTLEHVLEHL